MIMPDLSPFEQQYSEWAETMHIEKTKFSVGMLSAVLLILLRNGRLYQGPTPLHIDINRELCCAYVLLIFFFVFMMHGTTIKSRASVNIYRSHF